MPPPPAGRWPERLRLWGVLLGMASGVAVIGALLSAPALDANRLIDDRRRGQAAVEIIEFSDFACASCAAAAELLDELVDQGLASVSYRSLLTVSEADAGAAAARAALAAGLQGAFWKMHDLLFATQAEWRSLSASAAAARFAEYARGLGLDVERFVGDLRSRPLGALLRGDQAAALEAGVRQVPGLLIGGHPYRGALRIGALTAALEREALAHLPTPEAPRSTSPAPERSHH